MRIVAFLAVTLTASSSYAADYAARGPRATTTSNLPSGFAGATGGKLVVPNESGKYPLVIASHGWSASSANQVGWAEHFASYGFVVIAPDFPSPFAPDAAKNRDIIKAAVAGAPSVAADKVDATRFALEGHSAGALATTLAAADLKPRATILFDPVDRDDAGKKATPSLCAPVLSTFAKPSSCNSSAAWFAFRGDVKGPLVSFRVKGSTHCDGENAARFACGSFCGGAADSARQASYARYATAMLLAELAGDAAAAATLSASATDSALESVIVRASPSCATKPPSDGGVDAATSDAATDDAATDDAATTDAISGPVDDAFAATDAASDRAAITTDARADVGGCGCRASRTSYGPLSTPLLALLLLARRRRRAA